MKKLTRFDVAKKLLEGLTRKPNRVNADKNGGEYRDYYFGNVVIEFYICNNFITTNLSYSNGYQECHSMVFDWFFDDEEYTNNDVEMKTLKVFIKAINKNDAAMLFLADKEVEDHIFEFYSDLNLLKAVCNCD